MAIRLRRKLRAAPPGSYVRDFTDDEVAALSAGLERHDRILARECRTCGTVRGWPCFTVDAHIMITFHLSRQRAGIVGAPLVYENQLVRPDGLALRTWVAHQGETAAGLALPGDEVSEACVLRARHLPDGAWHVLAYHPDGWPKPAGEWPDDPDGTLLRQMESTGTWG